MINGSLINGAPSYKKNGALLMINDAPSYNKRCPFL